MNRDEALALMQEHTRSPSLRQHMLAVEAAMRAYAVRYREDPQASGSSRYRTAYARMAASTASMCWRSEGDLVCSCMSASASSRFMRSDIHVPAFCPQLQHQLRPKPARVVASHRAVFGQQRRLEQPIGERREPGIEPARYGYGEAAFLPLDDAFRNESARGFL